MKIALFGGTSGIGRDVLTQALAQGHEVQALARQSASLDGTAAGLTVVAGDVRDETAVARCIAGSDAVICTLGTRQGEAPIEADGTRAIVAGMKRHGVRRLLVVTSIGVGDSKDQVPFAFKMIMKTVLRKVMAAKEEQEALVKASGLDWTIVRPGGLTNEPASGRFTASLDKSLVAGQVARADVAAFLLQQLDDDTFLRQTPAIT